MTCGNGRNGLTMDGREWVMLLALAALWGSSFFFFKVMVAAFRHSRWCSPASGSPRSS